MNTPYASSTLADVTETIASQMITDDKGELNPSFKAAQNSQHKIGEMIDAEKLAHFAIPFKIPTLYALNFANNQDTGDNIQTLVGQLQANQVMNFLHFSQTRKHITGIHIRKDENGFLHAKIADSLANESAELQMVLNAIAETNKIAHNAIIEKINSAANAEQQKLVGLVMPVYNGENFVKHVITHRQQTTNSCGFHAVVNLYALNQNPNIPDVRQFGNILEAQLSPYQGQSVKLNTLGNNIKNTFERGT